MQINKPMIDSLKALATATREAQRAERKEASARYAETAGLGEQQDQITTDQQSSLIERALQADSSAREERIARLRQEYLSGEYEVDAKALAKSLVSSLLGTPAEDAGYA